MEVWNVGRREGVYAFVATITRWEERVEWGVWMDQSGLEEVVEGCGAMD